MESRWATIANLTQAHRRGVLAVAIAALIAVLIIGLLLVRAWNRSSAAFEPTIWDAISSGITDEGVPVETALQAFAYLSGIDIPGVRLPSGAAGGDAPTSATGALRWVRGHWTELTPDQRAAIDGFIDAAPNDLRIPVTGPAGEPIAAAGDRVATVDSRVPSGLVPALVTTSAATATVGDAIRDDVLATLAHIGPKLGLPTIREGIYLKDVSLTLTDDSGLRKDGSYTFWLTQPVQEGDNYSPCNLTVYKNLWSKETPGQPLSATMHVTLTHEIVHCYQYEVIGDIYTADLMPLWIMEGSAIWLAGNDTGIVEPMTPGLWRNQILGTPWLPLTARSYDAYGWYALLDHLGRPMWSLFADAWRAASTSAGAQRSEAFIAVLDGDQQDVTHAWAPLHAREDSWNDPWVPYGLGLPADVRSPRISVAATGAGHLDTLPDRSNAVYTVTGSEGEIVFVETDGLDSAHDGALHSVLAFTSQRFCVEGDCICPPGTRRAGELVADVDMLLPFVVAFQAPKGGAGQRISSRTLEQECGRDERSPSPSAPASGKPPVATGHAAPRCGTRCPGSNGDPHMQTVDGVSYEFQAAGEFTLLRTPDGSVELQARQEPSKGTELGKVSNNTAIALRIGDRRVAVYAMSGHLEVRVDGVVQTGTAPIEVGGGRLETHVGGIEIDLPDGTVVWALTRGSSGIYVLVDPSEPLVQTGVGLIGRSAPGLRIPRLPDGTALPAALDRNDAYALKYQRFADAWRLTDATTLFDYDAGNTTATYTIHDYPAAPKVATLQELDPAKAAIGREACAAVADTQLQDQCAFDVAVTGDTGYVGSYVAIQSVAEQGTVALDLPIQPTGSTPPVTAANPPVEVVPLLHRLAGSALAADGTLYISAVMADRTGRVFAIDPLTGAVLRQVGTTGAGEVVVAAGSVWVGEFSAARTGTPPCSVTRLDPATLAVQATVATVCQSIGLGTDLAAVGDEVWFVDPTAANASGADGSLRLIDTATNGAAASVPMPFTGGVLRASSTALFYGESTKGQYRLRPGETALTRIGVRDTNAFPAGWPAGDGLWAVVDGRLALYSTVDGPDGTLDLNDADGGILVAADAESVFIERAAASGGGNELWRRYLDGRVPTRLAVAASTASGLGPQTLAYVDAGTPTLLVSETAVVKLWVLVSRADPAESMLLVQGARLPPR